MNDMRKLMEAIQQINEGWDPEGIAQAIYDDVQEGGSALELAAQNSNEPYRAMVYEFGNLTGLYNAEALDGSEIWNRIIDKLEELFSSEEIEEDDGDVESKHRSDEEFMHDVIKLCDEGEEALMDDGMSPMDQLEVLAQVLQDISNMARLRASGRPYAPIHEEAKGYRVFHAGPVEVKMGMGEVALYHGHGENMFLSDDEFSMFINAIGQLGESTELEEADLAKPEKLSKEHQQAIRDAVVPALSKMLGQKPGAVKWHRNPYDEWTLYVSFPKKVGHIEHSDGQKLARRLNAKAFKPLYDDAALELGHVYSTPDGRVGVWFERTWP